MALQSVLDFVAEQAPLFADLSDRIWDMPELGLHEERSSATLADALEAAGFSVERSDLMRRPDVLRRAREEFRAETGEADYVSPVRDLDRPVFDV